MRRRQFRGRRKTPSQMASGLFERKLAAILAADVGGQGRLVEEDGTQSAPGVASAFWRRLEDLQDLRYLDERSSRMG